VLLLALAAAACAGGGAPHASDRGARTVLMTEHDDVRAGTEASADVRAQIGLFDDPALTAYVQGIGAKLVRGLPVRSFAYQFAIVDQVEPNAFALPGGYVFVSRGLLLLANDEDELACVIGHEITHVANRHAAQQQALARSGSPLTMPWTRAAQMASYSRDMERNADEGGQVLCAAAGYDPAAMASMLRTLTLAERLRAGVSRTPGWFDTHPGEQERASIASVRARELRWRRDPALGDPRQALLRRLDGMPAGQRPEAGVFVGDWFLHPELDFQVLFPHGWRQQNSAGLVGAMAPERDAVVQVTGQPPADSPQAAADAWLAMMEKTQKLDVEESKRVQVAAGDAWRLGVRGATAGGSLRASVTFVPHAGATYLITGMAPSMRGGAYEGRFLSTARSFGPLAPERRAALRVERVRIATARPGETLAALSQRTGNAWDLQTTAVSNALFTDHRFAGGEWVKVTDEERVVERGPQGLRSTSGR
jgi:predicted Zn-dependent protease